MGNSYALLGDISIHTPAWGVTPLAMPYGNNQKHFNPHARVGRDASKMLKHAVQLISIHTPAWGVTVNERFNSWIKINFNPHARVGRDKDSRKTANRGDNFNPHARVGRDFFWH